MKKMGLTIVCGIISLGTSSIFAKAPSAGVFSFSSPSNEITMEKFLSEKYIISINSTNEKLDVDTCQKFKEAILKVYKTNQTKCVLSSSIDKSEQELQKKHSFLISINSSHSSEQIKVRASYLDATEHDFKDLKWTINTSDQNDYLNEIETIAVKLADYDLNAKEYKDALFYRGIAVNDEIQPLPGDQFFIKSSGAYVNKDIAKVMFAQESEQNKNYMRAGMEVGAFLGIGKALYMLGQEAMKEDWDFDNSTWSDYKERIFTTNQMKFDDNSIAMNWGHAYAGVLYYHSARNNGFSSKESFLVALASSSIWEYLGENKEVVSINDQVITGIGGSIIGEAAYQISNMLKSKDSKIAKTLAIIINPVGAFNDWIDGKTLAQAHRDFSKEYGFDGSAYSKFDLTYGLQSLVNDKKDQSKTLAQLGLETEVINLPVHNLGKVQSIVYDPVMAEVNIDFTASKEGIEDFHSVTKVVLAGYFAKDIKMDEKGKKSGYSYFIGPAAKTEYRSRGVGHEDDFFATVNVIGSTLDVTYFKAGTKVRFAVDIYADFAMVKPYATKAYLKENPSFDRTASVLKKRGYYYATGYTSSLKLELENGNISGGLSMVSHYFDSINNKSLDRHSDRVLEELELSDEYKSVNIWVGYKPVKNTKIKLGLERIMREGTIRSSLNKYHTDDTEDRIYLKVEKAL